MHPMSYFILALAFTAFVFVVICMLTKSSSTTITTTTPNVLSQNIITFNSVPGVDYSTMENVEKTFTLGTFVAELVLDSLSFNFNTSNTDRPSNDSNRFVNNGLFKFFN